MPLRAGYHRPASEMPFISGVSLAGRWWPIIECWLGSFEVLQGIWTSIVKKPYIFVIFQGWEGGGPDPVPPPPPLIHTCNSHVNMASLT